MKREAVILVHGLWLVGWTLKYLAGDLEENHYRTRMLTYDSVLRDPAYNAAKLIRAVGSMDADRVHLVGHSLGGLVILKALAAEPSLPPGRIVMMGTPLKGSNAARRFNDLPGGQWLLGKSQDILTRHEVDPAPGRDVGMVAGTLPLGLGGVVAHLASPHDGTVAVDETRADWLTDHVELNVSHMSMLISDRVNRRVLRFLRYGAFS